MSEYGDETVDVRIGNYASPANYHPAKRQYTKMSLADYVQRLRDSDSEMQSRCDVESQSETTPYAGNLKLPVEVATCLSLSPPCFYRADFYRPAAFGLGHPGAVTPLHRDSSDNFVFHLDGTKRWTLFAPEHGKSLRMDCYEGAGSGGGFAFSMLEIGNVPEKSLPEEVLNKAMQLDVHAGEVLYLPMGWHHHVRCLDRCLSANYWVQDSTVSPGILKCKPQKGARRKRDA